MMRHPATDVHVLWRVSLSESATGRRRRSRRLLQLELRRSDQPRRLDAAAARLDLRGERRRPGDRLSCSCRRGCVGPQASRPGRALGSHRISAGPAAPSAAAAAGRTVDGGTRPSDAARPPRRRKHRGRVTKQVTGPDAVVGGVARSGRPTGSRWLSRSQVDRAAVPTGAPADGVTVEGHATSAARRRPAASDRRNPVSSAQELGDACRRAARSASPCWRICVTTGTGQLRTGRSRAGRTTGLQVVPRPASFAGATESTPCRRSSCAGSAPPVRSRPATSRRPPTPGARNEGADARSTVTDVAQRWLDDEQQRTWRAWLTVAELAAAGPRRPAAARRRHQPRRLRRPRDAVGVADPQPPDERPRPPGEPVAEPAVAHRRPARGARLGAARAVGRGRPRQPRRPDRRRLGRRPVGRARARRRRPRARCSTRSPGEQTRVLGEVLEAIVERLDPDHSLRVRTARLPPTSVRSGSLRSQDP